MRSPRQSPARWSQSFKRAFKSSTVCALAALVAATPTSLSAREATREVALRPVADEAATPSPLLLLVSLRKQRIRVFDINGEVTSSRVSSGQPGFDTPTGVFSILEKNVDHESNIYDGAPMPYMQRLTWSGIALHAGNVPGYRASHGCIRLPASFARSLFNMTKMGNRVVVAHDEIAPVKFDHPNLFKPLPSSIQGAKAGDARKAETKVAANDPMIGASESFAAMPAISPEMTEAIEALGKTGPQPRTRLEAEQMAREKVKTLQDDLKAAEVRKSRADEKSKVVLQETDAAMATLATERKNIELVRSVVAMVEKKHADAVRAFEAYFKQPASASAKNARTEDREFELEDAILDSTIEADNVRGDAARKEMRFAEVQTSLAKFEADRTAATTEATDSQKALKTAQDALAAAKKDVDLRSKPLSVFISLKSQKLFIRQGFEPVLEAPIQLDQIGGPVGTHVFTAMRYGRDDSSFEWKLVTANVPSGGYSESSKKNKKREDEGHPPSRNPQELATIALDAIDMPDQVREFISQRARPGASIIISDRDLPKNENGKGTEFVVLTR